MTTSNLPPPWQALIDRRRFIARGAAWLGSTLCSASAWAAPLAYELKATEIAPDTYAVYGAREYFSLQNGGNIVNVAFVVTDDGVVVIDTGPSRLYGQALKALIAATTEQPIARIYITHHHPDHMFGNQAFDRAAIASLPGVIANLKRDGEMFAENMYRLIGDWMQGTELVVPAKTLEASSERFGGHDFELIPLAGHTSADLVVLDKSTGVLFAGDIAFLDRAPTTPHADLALWQKALAELDNSAFSILLPGHGPAERGKRAIAQTRDYLTWLDRALAQAVRDGRTMTETMQTPVPARLREVALAHEEMTRSVAHLFARYEEPVLPIVSDPS